MRSVARSSKIDHQTSPAQEHLAGARALLGRAQLLFPTKEGDYSADTGKIAAGAVRAAIVAEFEGKKMDSVWSTVVGAFVGASASIAATAFAEYLRNRRINELDLIRKDVLKKLLSGGIYELAAYQRGDEVAV